MTGKRSPKPKADQASGPPHMPPVPRHVPRTPRLDTIDRVRAELARMYRHCRHGGLSWEVGTKSAYVLMAIGRLLEGSVIEERLTALEQQHEPPHEEEVDL